METGTVGTVHTQCDRTAKTNVPYVEIRHKNYKNDVRTMPRCILSTP